MSLRPGAGGPSGWSHNWQPGWSHATRKTSGCLVHVAGKRHPITLNAAIGTKSRVTGDSINAGNITETLASAFTPPRPAYKALVKNGLCPCRMAHGNQPSHYVSSPGSANDRVMVCVGWPVNQTCRQMITDSRRNAPITPT